MMNYTDWSKLMLAPWGRFDANSKQEKARALRECQEAFDKWQAERIAAGKWRVGVIPAYHGR